MWLFPITSEQSLTAKSTPTANPSSCKECKKGICPKHQYGMTSEHLTPRIWHLYNSYSEVSLVKIFLLQEMEKVWQESEADYFSRSSACVAQLSHDSSSWKTFLPLLPEEVQKWLEPLPRWGMTVDGALYPQLPLEQFIDENDGSYWLTPSTMEHLPVRTGEALENALHRGKGRESRRKVSGRLNEQVAYPQMWPTPRANKIGGYASPNFSPTLEQVVMKFPTPKARDSKDNGESPSELRRNSPNLPCMVKMMLPTPRARDAIPEGLMAGMRRQSLSLPTYVKMMIATPAASQANKPIRKPTPSSSEGRHGENLQDSIGRINPELIGKKLSVPFVESMMAYPIGWTDLKPLEMQ